MKKKAKKPKKKYVPTGNPIGRPPMYKTPEELQVKIDEYIKNPPRKFPVFVNGERIDLPVLTITGLVLHCGFCDRMSFYDMEKRKDFSYTIKRARAFIEEEYEMQLRHGNSAGAIFALKNFGWIDRQVIDQTVNDISVNPLFKGKSNEEVAAIITRKENPRAKD